MSTTEQAITETEQQIQDTREKARLLNRILKLGGTIAYHYEQNPNIRRLPNSQSVPSGVYDITHVAYAEPGKYCLTALNTAGGYDNIQFTISSEKPLIVTL